MFAATRDDLEASCQLVCATCAVKNLSERCMQCWQQEQQCVGRGMALVYLK